MKLMRPMLIVLALAAMAVVGIAYAQDEPAKPGDDQPKPEAEATVPDWQRLEQALPYLSSSVPEHSLQAEQLIERGAEMHFDALVSALPDQPRRGREVLLRVLASTTHEGRVSLFLGVLCDRESRRTERTIASRALKTARQDDLLKLVEARLGEPDLDQYRRIQCCTLLGTITSARAQGLAEDVLSKAEADALLAFASEDAVLRSTIETQFGQPAWSRYQNRHPAAPKMTLREFQDALDELALPRAADRARAESKLGGMIDGDVRVLLALARSPWPERAAFALKQLEDLQSQDLQLATQAVMLDLVMTGEQTIALMAMDVAIAGSPPTDDEMEVLRPVISIDSEARLEAILEGMARGSDLADLRIQRRRLEATLRPLLLRRSAFDPEVRVLIQRFEGIRDQLEMVEAQWAGGWRREFETEILGTKLD